MNPDDNRGTFDPDKELSGQDDDSGANAARKKLFITAAVAITLIILAVIIAVLLSWPGVEKRPPAAHQSGQGGTSLRKYRAAYGKVPSSVADPAAVTQSSSADTVIYQQSSIIDACSLLPVRLLRQHNLLVAPSVAPGAISRHFFDGSSEAIIERWNTAETLTQQLNDCSYSLVDKKGKDAGDLYISVYQPAYANSLALRSRLDHYLRRGQQIAGANVYDRTAKLINHDRTYYFLVNDNVYVNLEINLPPSASERVKSKLLRAVAKNLQAAVQHPSGPAQFAYQSPTFSGHYVSACAISSATDVQLLFRALANPSVQERIAPAVGITDRGGQTSNFVVNQCIRRTAEPRTIASTLTVTTRSFETANAASSYLKTQRQKHTIDPATKNIIGDATFYNMAGNASEDTLFFRVNAAVIKLTTYRENMTLPLEVRIQRLRTVAVNMFDRLKGDQDADKATAAGEKSREAKP